MTRDFISPWLVLLALFGSAAFAADWQGRPLVELLDSLNEQGHRIIYSSDAVSDDLLVTVEPDLTDFVPALQGELASHGLELTPGQGGVWLVIIAVILAVMVSALLFGNNPQHMRYPDLVRLLVRHGEVRETASQDDEPQAARIIVQSAKDSRVQHELSLIHI